MPLGFGKATQISAANSIFSGGSGESLQSASGDPLSSGAPMGTLLYTLTNPDIDGDGFDYFGGSEIAFTPDGQYLAVGAKLQDNTAGTSSSIGALYLYDAIDGTLQWTVYGGAGDDRLGTKVACTNNYVYVNHERWDNGGASNVGKVTSYNISNGSLNQTFTPSSNSSNRYFGFDIAAEATNDQVAIYERATDKVFIYNANGTLDHTINSVLGTTAASIMDMDGQQDYWAIGTAIGDVAKYYNWSGTLQSSFSQQASANYWGEKMAVSSSYVAVGDPSYDTNNGRISVYNAANGNHIRNITGGSNWRFGDTLDIADGTDFLIAGSPWQDGMWQPDGSHDDNGYAYLYDMSDGSLLHTFQPTVQVKNGYFGLNVDATRHRIAIGAPGEENVRVYSTGE